MRRDKVTCGRRRRKGMCGDCKRREGGVRGSEGGEKEDEVTGLGA